ncbi:DUF1501 domain-containing protein [Lentisphaera profundi]|uniref:DUF1501 domain-containing protein n=1 Tax=Lentisphaera profundi TaxID=1658616 RepID=A0ABY7VWS2_9BACT|nr:DUF1501 domain-containing protein [Lentisphaera profundi]WDE97332.1 DUF1501 domain-containing protein [Lentisphaera profundi]
MKELEATLHKMNRRQALKMSAGGLGYMALGDLLAKESPSALQAHHKPKAKRVIYLFQSGGPSQIDMFDPKPMLNKFHGQDIFKFVKQNGRLTGFNDKHKVHPLIKSKYSFKKYGQSGSWVSELLPHMSGVMDDVCTIRSVSTKPVNHDPAMTFMQTGHNLPGRPSIGSWLSYGLGSMNKNLPDYVVLVSKGDLGNMQPLNSRLWGNGFLPGRYQGVRLRSGKDPVLYLKDPAGKTLKDERQLLDVINELNEEEFQRHANPAVETRISQYEMAFRMQSSVPDLSDLSDEPASTFKLYGEEARKPGTYAFNCLMARRLAERDVRFVQLYHSGWDHHFNLPAHLPKRCRETDQATAALITDLKQRGLLDDTIVVWGGEFGRTAFSQDGKTPVSYGRDHHANCFTKIVAGGGFKAGLNYGQTDEFGYNVVKDEVPVHDLHATILHQLGLDHERLTYLSQGRRYRLTDVHGHVVKDLLI